MNEKTARQYIGTATAFYKRHGIYDTVKATQLNIEKAMLKESLNKSCPSWQKLKTAIIYDQKERGFFKSSIKLKDLKNPEADNPNRVRSKVVKRVLKNDYDKVLSLAIENDNRGLEACLKLIKSTGCRPSSVAGIKILDHEEGKVFIPAGKPNEDGTRGADAIIYVNKLVLARINDGIEKLSRVRGNDPVENARQVLGRYTKKLFPRRKKNFTFKSLRHQKGSELKAAGMSTREIAACLGHQSSASCSVYGDGRTKATGGAGMRPDPDVVKAVRNDNPLGLSPQEHIDRGQENKQAREHSNESRYPDSSYDF